LKLIPHLTLHLRKILKQFGDAANDFKSGKYSESGETFGDATRLAFFWDYNSSLEFLDD